MHRAGAAAAAAAAAAVAAATSVVLTATDVFQFVTIFSKLCYKINKNACQVRGINTSYSSSILPGM